MGTLLRPEFRNRLDGTIQFGKLDQQTMVKIVKKFIDELNSLLKDRHVFVKPDAEAVELLIKNGFNSKMGARPLARTIDEMIKKPLSKEILFGNLQNGGIVEIGANEDKLSFKFVETLPVVNEKPEEADVENS